MRDRRVARAAGLLALLAGTARAEDPAAPVVSAQRALAERGVNLGAGPPGFGQGLMSGTGRGGIVWGSEVDLRLGRDGEALGLWQACGVSAHLEQGFGQDMNRRGDGSVLPLNTALGFPIRSGRTTDLSLTVTQRVGPQVSLTLDEVSMRDAAPG